MAPAEQPEGERGAGPRFGPGDWQALREQIGIDGHEQQCLDACPICRAADILRAAGPPGMSEGIGELQREMLLTARALIDRYLERTGTSPDPDSRVEQIPID